MSDPDRINLGDGFYAGATHTYGPEVVRTDIAWRHLFLDKGPGLPPYFVGAVDADLIQSWVGKRPFRNYGRPTFPNTRCTLCGAPLDVPGRPWSRNCGGDCLACMAEAGDAECKTAIDAMVAGEAVVKVGRALLHSIHVERLRGRLYTHVPDAKLMDLRDALPLEKEPL